MRLYTRTTATRKFGLSFASITYQIGVGVRYAITMGQLTDLLKSTADAAFAVDDERFICGWNDAAERLLGYSSAEVYQKLCASILRGNTVFGSGVCGPQCKVIDCALRGQGVPGFEMEVRASSGKLIWVRSSSILLRDERPGRHLLVHMLTDISRTKWREEITTKFVRIARQVSHLSDAGNHAELPPSASLTEREAAVLRLIAEGRSSIRIAQELHVSYGTLRNHLSHIHEKLHTNNRVAAILLAKSRGII